MSRAYDKALEVFPISFSERMGYKSANLPNERRNAFEKGYEQALNDVKELINKRYELHNPEYLKTRSTYLEGLLDGLDDAEQDVDELLK